MYRICMVCWSDENVFLHLNYVKIEMVLDSAMKLAVLILIFVTL
jgi:hypothetical protein